MVSSFDKYHRSYEDVVGQSISFSGLKHDFFIEAKVDRLRRLFGETFGAYQPRLVDFGCGTGTMHARLAGLTGGISGCDPSAQCLETARSNNPDVDYRQVADLNTPWADHMADVALAVCVYHHVVPEERHGLIAEMTRVVRPGGLVIIIEHNPWNPLTQLAVARCPFDHDAQLLDWRAAVSLMMKAGLIRPRSEHFLLLPSSNFMASWLDRAMSRAPIGAQYMAWGFVP